MKRLYWWFRHFGYIHYASDVEVAGYAMTDGLYRVRYRKTRCKLCGRRFVDFQA